MVKYIIGALLFLAVVVTILIIGAPSSKMRTTPLNEDNKTAKGTVCVLLALTIALTIFPMGWCPTWNGENPKHRNQYELMAESLIEGKLYIDYDDIDPKLSTLDNPYDIKERKAAGVKYHFDHAFYKGKYYMYFGVAPAILVFVPYRLLTGTNLNSYHATQIFTVFFIIGVFLLFEKLAKLFFKDLNYLLYSVLSVAFSLMSVWYVMDAPSLYCIPIIAGICFEVWSLYYFFTAVYDENISENKAIAYATLGSFTGALTFACRPPIALANALVLPLVIVFLKRRKLNLKLFFKLILAASPYLVIGILLMLYNYFRFDNPFEFGQTYQLTVADQREYSNLLVSFNLKKEIKGIFEFLFYSGSVYSVNLPHGILITFPILLLIPLGLLIKPVRKELKKNDLGLFIIVTLLTVFVIMAIDMLWSPFFVPRYRLDIYWILGILCYIIIGMLFKTAEKNELIRKIVFAFAVLTVFISIALFVVPFDSNFTYLMIH